MLHCSARRFYKYKMEVEAIEGREMEAVEAYDVVWWRLYDVSDGSYVFYFVFRPVYREALVLPGKG